MNPRELYEKHYGDKKLKFDYASFTFLRKIHKDMILTKGMLLYKCCNNKNF